MSEGEGEAVTFTQEAPQLAQCAARRRKGFKGGASPQRRISLLGTGSTLKNPWSNLPARCRQI